MIQIYPDLLCQRLSGGGISLRPKTPSHNTRKKNLTSTPTARITISIANPTDYIKVITKVSKCLTKVSFDRTLPFGVIHSLFLESLQKIRCATQQQSLQGSKQNRQETYAVWGL